MEAASIIDVSPEREVDNDKDPIAFAQASKDFVWTQMENKLAQHRGLKWNLLMVVKMKKTNREGDDIIMDFYFNSQLETLLDSVEFTSQFDSHVDNIWRKIDEFVQRGSGWIVERVIRVELHLAPYKPTNPSSYIATPEYIKKKRATLNIKNDDDLCFAWSILAQLYPIERNLSRNHPRYYLQHLTKLNLKGLKFPLAVSDVKKFERLNPSISVNVFAFEGRGNYVYPVHVTSFKQRDHHVNLMLLTKKNKSHYVLITNMSRLLCDRTHYKGEYYYCDYCLHGFIRQDLLDTHLKDCKQLGFQKVRLPRNDEKWLSFKSVEKQLPVPVIVYADFESYTTKIQRVTKENVSFDPYEMHVPSGYAFYIVWQNNFLPPVKECYHGSDVVERFLRRLREEYDKIEKVLSRVTPMIITDVQREEFKKATECFLCEKPFRNDKVADHDHLTGLYRGAAHRGCNLQFKYRGRATDKPVNSKKHWQQADGYTIPVVFHNLRGYDGHLIMKQFKQCIFPGQRITCIPKTMENYISFTIGNLRFIDSYQFMSESLDKLVSNLRKEDFKHMARNFPADKLYLLLRKGIFPYEYWDSPSRLSETSFPPRSVFHSKLTDEDVSDYDYFWALSVWGEFDMKTLADYHDIYLTTDVLLLADVFEHFRATCQRIYKLDPAHYFSSPGLAWDAMLKMTKVELELLDQREFHDICDKGIRGGICSISRKYARANNKYVPEQYDPTKPSNYIVYLDCNNLYGTAMTQPMPERDFKILPEEEVADFDFSSVPDDSPIGYILEVDLDYPDSLHNLHSEYPLCPENVIVTEEDLSPYSKTLAQKLNVNPGKCKKLICNLKAKKRYSVHYRNLKYYVKLGMKVNKIHRILSFKQSCWLKQFIDFNTEMRKQATNEFEKAFFKLMNNSVYGKTMENTRKYKDVKFATSPSYFEKLVCKPTFKSFKIFSEDLTAVHLAKQQIELNKPTYVGLSVLELSKLIMFQFHYDCMKSLYGDRAKLLMTDTDSLIYDIETEDLYDDMVNNLHWFDTSDYPKNHSAYSEVNKKVLGKFKDETNGNPIVEFVGLRPKMYSILEKGNIEKKKTAKGISRVVTKKMTHQSYLDSLFGENSTTAKMIQIRSENHTVVTAEVKKTALSPYDDKRFVLEDKISTLAHGHYVCSFVNDCSGDF